MVKNQIEEVNRKIVRLCRLPLCKKKVHADDMCLVHFRAESNYGSPYLTDNKQCFVVGCKKSFGKYINICSEHIVDLLSDIEGDECIIIPCIKPQENHGLCQIHSL